jgi:hypothetical protein
VTGRLGLALALVAGASGCGGQATAPRPATPPAASGLKFVDVTGQSGIVLTNVSGDPVEKLALPEGLGQGAAALDYDGDGLLDLFIANGDVLPGTTVDAEPRPALYRNLGDWKFEDVTREAGLELDGWMHGANRVDFDADGHPDLYVTVYRGPNLFLRNQGDGRFRAMPEWGAADPGPSTCAAFFDADGDGDLDLHVGNYVDYDPASPPNGGRPCEWRGLQVQCGPKGLQAAADSFWENRDGRLVEASAAFGFDAVAASYTLGSVAGDLDRDGDVDLYVANDSEPNYLFENVGGRFVEAGPLRGADRNEDGRSQAGMGVDLGDVDNDGRFDLFVTNFSHDSNTLYRNRATPGGETLFEDATHAAKLGMESYRFLSWGTRFLDLDADGWLDIVLVSGHVYPQVDRAPVGTRYRQRNQLFLNRGVDRSGRLAFDELPPEAAGAFAAEQPSRGLVAADLDNDGDPDFLVVELDTTPTLIRNESTVAGHWIGFELRGPDGNVDAVGARVAVEDGTGAVRWLQRVGGGSYLSTGDPRLHLGLGAAGGTVRRVTVWWDADRSSEYGDLAVDRYWRLEAGATEAASAATPRR